MALARIVVLGSLPLSQKGLQGIFTAYYWRVLPQATNKINLSGD